MIYWVISGLSPQRTCARWAHVKRGEGSLPLLFLIYLLRRIKGILAKAAGGADPIFGDVLPGCAGGYTVFGIAQGGVIDIAAGALVFHKEAS